MHFASGDPGQSRCASARGGRHGHLCVFGRIWLPPTGVRDRHERSLTSDPPGRRPHDWMRSAPSRPLTPGLTEAAHACVGGLCGCGGLLSRDRAVAQSHHQEDASAQEHRQHGTDDHRCGVKAAGRDEVALASRRRSTVARRRRGLTIRPLARSHFSIIRTLAGGTLGDVLERDAVLSVAQLNVTGVGGDVPREACMDLDGSTRPVRYDAACGLGPSHSGTQRKGLEAIRELSSCGKPTYPRSPKICRARTTRSSRRDCR